MPTRYFECKKDGHNKFWEISWSSDKSEYTTRWGPIGFLGTLKKKVFSSPTQAATEVEKIIRSKINKGYEEREVTQEGKEEEKKRVAGPKLDYLEIW